MKPLLAFLCLCAPVTASPFLTDNFTGTDGTAITSHSIDSGGTLAQTVGTNPAVIASNRARSIASAAQLYAYSATPPDAEFDVELSAIRYDSDPSVGIGWIDPATKNGYIALANTGSGYVRLSRMDGGTFVTLGTYVIPGGFGTGAAFGVKVQFRNSGKTLLLDTGSGYVARVTSTDGTYTGGTQKVTLYMGGASSVGHGTHVDWLTATPATAPPLTAGTASVSSFTDSLIALESTTATWGTSPYTYQWHRSTTSGFMPGSGTLISGATSLYYEDHPGTPGQYFYKCVVTDSTSATAASNQVTAPLAASPVAIGFIGDSITLDASGPWPTDLANRLGVTPLRTVTAVNRGSSGAATSDWAPNGSSYQNAAAAFSAAGCTLTIVMLGVNDSKQGVDAATYGTRLAAVVNAEVAAGRTVVVAYPSGYSTGVSAGFDEAALSRLTDYLGQIDALCNGTTILKGPTTQFSLFASKPTLLNADGVHPNPVGSSRMASVFHGWFVELGK